MGCGQSKGSATTAVKRNAPNETDRAAGLPPILLIPVDKLLALAEIPRLGISLAQRKSLGYGDKELITDPKIKATLIQDWRNLSLCVGSEYLAAQDYLVDLKDVYGHGSVIGFISHNWLRGWPGASGYVDRPHPDSADNAKHKLTCQALRILMASVFKEAKNKYVWIDFCCINQDGNPAAELKQLDLIIESCDFLLTPIHDEGSGAWKLRDQYVSLFEDYLAEAWQRYLTRAWCLVELMYAANIPLKNVASGVPVLKGSQTVLKRRMHFLYGTRELNCNSVPLVLPPLQNSFFEQYNPLTHGEVSNQADKAKIKELVHAIQPYLDASAVTAGYIGEFDADGNQCGHGKYVFADGAYYEGEFKNNTFEGYATYVFANGNVFEGNYSNNMRNGRGKLTYANAESYDGDWKDDVISGHGVYTSSNGNVYDGEFENSAKSGHGKIVFADQDTYEGEWANDKINGIGKYVFANGNTFEGQFANGYRSGQGRMTFNDGAFYEGHWESDAMDGSGRYVYGNGGVYEGEFRNGVRSGRGKYVGADGAERVGEWRDDAMLVE